MSTGKKVMIYLAALACVFSLSFIGGRTLVPEKTVSNWTERAQQSGSHEDDAKGEHDGGGRSEH